MNLFQLTYKDEDPRAGTVWPQSLKAKKSSPNLFFRSKEDAINGFPEDMSVAVRTFRAVTNIVRCWNPRPLGLGGCQVDTSSDLKAIYKTKLFYKGIMMKLLDGPQQANNEILERIGHLINKHSVFNSATASNESIVWAVNDMIPYVSKKSLIDFSGLRFSCKLGVHEFNYSISVSLGEVRIGILIPESLKEVPLSLLNSLELYNYSAPASPYKVVRLIQHKGVFIDHIFNARFGSTEVTFQALASNYSGSKEIEIIALAIANELIHINHGLMHAFSENGWLVTKSGIYKGDDQRIYELFSDKSQKELLSTLSIELSQLLAIAFNAYLVIAPMSDMEIESKVKLVNHEKKVEMV